MSDLQFGSLPLVCLDISTELVPESPITILDDSDLEMQQCEMSENEPDTPNGFAHDGVGERNRSTAPVPEETTSHQPTIDSSLFVVKNKPVTSLTMKFTDAQKQKLSEIVHYGNDFAGIRLTYQRHTIEKTGMKQAKLISFDQDSRGLCIRVLFPIPDDLSDFDVASAIVRLNGGVYATASGAAVGMKEYYRAHIKPGTKPNASSTASGFSCLTYRHYARETLEELRYFVPPNARVGKLSLFDEAKPAKPSQQDHDFALHIARLIHERKMPLLQKTNTGDSPQAARKRPRAGNPVTPAVVAQPEDANVAPAESASGSPQNPFRTKPKKVCIARTPATATAVANEQTAEVATTMTDTAEVHTSTAAAASASVACPERDQLLERVRLAEQRAANASQDAERYQKELSTEQREKAAITEQLQDARTALQSVEREREALSSRILELENQLRSAESTQQQLLAERRERQALVAQLEDAQADHERLVRERRDIVTRNAHLENFAHTIIDMMRNTGQQMIQHAQTLYQSYPRQEE